MAVKGRIRNFTSGGGSVSGYNGTGKGLVLGVRDPDSGRIFKHPRVKRDHGLASGGSVRVVNPNAMSGRVARRNGTLGIGLTGDRTY